MQEFGASLSQVDELYLLPIYPARELPVEGITSEELLKHVTIKEKKVASPIEVLHQLTKRRNCVIVTIGAGDIDQLITPLKEALL
jgi:UDP-N-acetylmuramate--alanine ligase